MKCIILKKFLLPLLLFSITAAEAQTKNENDLAATATTFANGQWADKAEMKKLDGLTSAAAVKYVAKKAEIISQSQSNALRDDRIISPGDEPLTDILNLKLGWILGFVENGKVVHVMISLGHRAAAGTGNLSRLGLGNTGKWEIVDLSAIKKIGDGQFMLNRKPVIIVCKSADQILNTNSKAAVKDPLPMNSKDNYLRDSENKQKEANEQPVNQPAGNAPPGNAPNPVPKKDDDSDVPNIKLSPAEQKISSANHNNWVKAFDFAVNTRKLSYQDINKIQLLDAVGAVKFIAVQAGIINAGEAAQINNQTIISPADKGVVNIKDIENGEIIGFVRNGKIEHIMIAGAYGDAFGINNLRTIGQGRDGVWEKLKLNPALLARNGFSLVTKSAIDITKTLVVPPAPANDKPVTPPEPPLPKTQVPPAPANDKPVTPPEPPLPKKQVPPAPANDKPVTPPEPSLPAQNYPPPPPPNNNGAKTNPTDGYTSAGLAFNPMIDIRNVGKYTVKDWSSYGDPANPNPALTQFAIFKAKKPANSKIMNVMQYVAVAYDFRDDHPTAEELRMANGDLVIYDASFNLLAVYDKDGKPKEMYCPESKGEMFNKYKLKID